MKLQEKEEFSINVGKIIYEHRQKLGWSAMKLARKIGMSDMVIFNIENNKVRVQFYTMVKISQALGIDINELIPKNVIKCPDIPQPRRIEPQKLQSLTQEEIIYLKKLINS